MNKEKIISNVIKLGKSKIKENKFDLPTTDSDFKEILRINNITKENNKGLIEELCQKYIEGQKNGIKETLEKAVENLTKEQIEKYRKIIDYNESIDIYGNFIELYDKLNFISQIPKIEKIKSTIKVFVFWSSSEHFKENEVLDYKQFVKLCDRAINSVRKEEERLGLYGIYDKTSYMLIFDDNKGNVIVTNTLRYDIGDYSSFKEYLKYGFENKNIQRLVEDYLELEEIENEEEEI